MELLQQQLASARREKSDAQSESSSLRQLNEKLKDDVRSGTGREKCQQLSLKLSKISQELTKSKTSSEGLRKQLRQAEDSNKHLTLSNTELRARCDELPCASSASSPVKREHCHLDEPKLAQLRALAAKAMHTPNPPSLRPCSTSPCALSSTTPSPAECHSPRLTPIHVTPPPLTTATRMMAPCHSLQGATDCVVTDVCLPVAASCHKTPPPKSDGTPVPTSSKSASGVNHPSASVQRTSEQKSVPSQRTSEQRCEVGGA